MRIHIVHCRRKDRFDLANAGGYVGGVEGVFLMTQYRNQVDQIKDNNVAYSELFLDT